MSTNDIITLIVMIGIGLFSFTYIMMTRAISQLKSCRLGLEEKQPTQTKPEHDNPKKKNEGLRTTGVPDIFWKERGEKEGKLEHGPELLEEARKLEEDAKRSDEEKYGPSSLNYISWGKFKEIAALIKGPYCEAEFRIEFWDILNNRFLGYRQEVVPFLSSTEAISFLVGSVSNRLRPELQDSPMFAVLSLNGEYRDNGRKCIRFTMTDNGSPMFTSTRYDFYIREK